MTVIRESKQSSTENKTNIGLHQSYSMSEPTPLPSARSACSSSIEPDDSQPSSMPVVDLAKDVA